MKQCNTSSSALCSLQPAEMRMQLCFFPKISALKYMMQAGANIKVTYHSSRVFLVYFDKNSYHPVQSGNTGKTATSPSGLVLMDFVITSVCLHLYPAQLEAGFKVNCVMEEPGLQLYLN